VEQITLAVAGMTCGHCVAAVRKAAAAVPGVTVHDVQIGRVDATLDPALTSAAVLTAAIAEEGYAAVVAA
jgi:copper chaperone